MHYQPQDLTHEALASANELILLEFGIDACPHCQIGLHAFATQDALKVLKHIAVEDGAGRRLGRSFKVKLWPTFIVLKDGVELARVVRPRTGEDFAPLIQALAHPA